MDAAADRPEFAPPPQPALLGGFLLALLAHLLLAAALAWGVQWQREVQRATVEAELWAALPQPAAPREEAPPPPPPPAPAVQAEPPRPSEADIALQREQEQRALAQRRAQEEELRKDRDRQREQAKRKQEERDEKLRVAAAEHKRAQQERLKQDRIDEQQRDRIRQESMRRMQGLAGAPTENAAAGGAAAVTRGPTASWAGRVRARVRPNIVFGDAAAGNPTAEVEVRLSPDGTIVGKRLVKSSGSRAWDDAVLRALDKTEMLPRDTDGTVPSPVILEFRPRD